MKSNKHLRYNQAILFFIELFALYFFIFSGYAKAQQVQGYAIAPFPRKNIEKMQIIDTGNIRVMYALNAEDINDPDTYIDLQCLEIGQTFSKYYSSFIYNNDSLVCDWLKKHPKAGNYPRWLGLTNRRKYNWSEYKYSEYFKNFETKTLTEFARMPYGVKNNRQYTETIPIQFWVLQKDILIINGYRCQKAICHFRGRNYTAWFTKDIPISNGPWKFGGLPGLILKVYDDHCLYTFECVKIEKIKFHLKKYNFEDYVPMERLELLKFQRILNENYYKTIGARMQNGKELPDPVSYEPLELK